MTSTPNSKTPPRNNYSNTHTPIASIKRPRSSLVASGRTSLTPQPRKNSSSSLNDSKSSIGSDVLSPMHGPKPVHRDHHDGIVRVDENEVSVDESTPSSSTWVSRKVDALFSPVLRFLDQSENEEDGDDKEVVITSASDSPPSASCSSSESAGTNVVNGDNGSHLNDSHDHDDDDGSLSIQGQEMPDSDEFNPWQFIQSLPPYSEVRHLTPARTLPPKSKDAPPITLVLDLDETLVHCSVEPVDGADLTFPVDFHGTTYMVHVKPRPFLFDFLEACRGKYEVVLFTASQKIYANELLNRIDPENKYIQFRLYRESCLAVEGNFLKDLNVLGRDLDQTILVDNSPHAFGYQVDNGIPIESWFDDPDDRELLKLERFLRLSCLGVRDVRPVLREKFQCQRLVDEAPPLFAHTSMDYH